jgi:microcystin-dependent protein
LSIAELPGHTHVLNATSEAGTAVLPTNNLLARSVTQIYVAPQNLQTMSPSCIPNVGGSQAHQNMQPFLTLTFCIALQGIFPSPN